MLETDGSFSVIGAEYTGTSALGNVTGTEAAGGGPGNR